MAASLFRRLGGAEGIAAIVDDAVDRHACHPLLAPRFRGRDLPELKARSRRFFGERTGGTPGRGTDADGCGHAGMHFGEQELLAVIDDLVAAMLERGVDAVEAGEVIGLLCAAQPATPGERRWRACGG
jgi:hemoglobin